MASWESFNDFEDKLFWGVAFQLPEQKSRQSVQQFQKNSSSPTSLGCRSSCLRIWMWEPWVCLLIAVGEACRQRLESEVICICDIKSCVFNKLAAGDVDFLAYPAWTRQTSVWSHSQATKLYTMNIVILIQNKQEIRLNMKCRWTAGGNGQNIPGWNILSSGSVWGPAGRACFPPRVIDLPKVVVQPGATYGLCS